MFNGIIYSTGRVRYLKKESKSFLLGISSSLIFKKKEIGSSISCNGVCLTLTDIKKKLFFFYISKETLNRSNLKFLKVNNHINLEKSLIYGQKISGHFLQGHIDTTAYIKNIIFDGKTWIIKFSINEKKFSKYLVDKASIGINGVSLTISKVKNNFFETNIIPHTLKLTNLKYLKPRNIVNVELDIFTKYVRKISK